MNYSPKYNTPNYITSRRRKRKMFSLGLVMDLDTTPKTQSIEEKFNDFIKIENVCSLKHTVERAKRSHGVAENICQICF